MRPKLLEAVPAVIREWVAMRGRNGKIDQTHLIIFWVVKQFGPGSAEEQIAINNNILNPHVCSQPRAAQVELMKWKENIRRLAELGSAPPALLMTYRAMESIFNVVFDKAEPMLNARWIALKNQLGLPYHIDQTAIEKVAAFADAELGALVLSGNSSLNPGLPLTENQKSRQQQIKEGEKKRAAAAKVKAEPPPSKNQPPQTDNKNIAAAMYNRSATTAMWANPCTNWTNNGTCTRGIACHFAHQGFPTSEKRCITCGKSDHLHKECPAPGGGKDANRDAAWTEYRKRKEAAAPAFKKGKGKGKDEKGKGEKGKGKSKGKGGKKGDNPTAKMTVDQEVARASAAVTPPPFPRDCIGLDSWANVHLIHQKATESSRF